MSQLVINISVPFVSVTKYAELVGISEHSVRSKIQLGYLPTIKQGKNRLINLAQLTKEALECSV